MADEHIDPIELLKEEMSNDEVACKVNAIHRLSTVVLAIGPAQCYEKLIPFLDSIKSMLMDRLGSEGGG
jgi:serine/threonine-protein phosphatase 2A regulatory subunit A